MIRVVVVDDEALVRSGFELILNASDGIQVVATAEGAQAADVIRREQPDVVLLDIRMPDVDGLTVLREIQTLPEPPTVAMLTTFDTDEYILTALRSGAAGFLLKDTEPEQLAQLVRTLAAGGVVMSPKASRALLRGHPGADTPQDADVARVNLLTDRERDVLGLMAEGLSNQAIRQRLFLSESAISKHTTSLFGKLGLADDDTSNRRVLAVLTYLGLT